MATNEKFSLGDLRLAAIGWWKLRRLRRRVARASCWRVADLPEDTFGRVTGRARQFETVLTAPLSGRACVYYQIEIEERGPFRMSNGLLASERIFVPFVLEDRHHHAVIDPTDARIEVRSDRATESLGYFDADSSQRALLQRYGLVARDWFNTTSLRFTESIIGLDHVISVIGAGTREPDPELPPEGVYRDGSATRLRLTSSARFSLVLTDDPATFAR